MSVPYASRRWRPSRRVVVLSVLALAGLGGVAALLTLRNWGGPTSRFDGYVYVESNRVRGNSVLAYRFVRGRFRLLAEYPTGGRGAVDFGQSGALDADGQLGYDPSRRLLFVVNQGSDSVAVFRVGKDGTLAAAPGSPFASGGKAPAGIGVGDGLVVVANKAQDPSRDLTLVRPAYAVFRVGGDGRLAPAGRFLVPAGASPTQALVVGRVVAGTEETGPFRSFTLETDGRLRQALGSPLEPESSIFPPRYDGARWAIGLVPHPAQALLYADQAATSQLLVYSYDAGGRLTFLRAVRNRGARLPCWTAVTPDGRRLYTANAGNGTVSAFDISHDPTAPRHLQTLPLERAGNPWGLAVAPDGRTLFVVDPRAVAEVHKGRGNRLHALAIRSSGRLRELAASPVRLPAGDDASPFGIVVVER